MAIKLRQPVREALRYKLVANKPCFQQQPRGRTYSKACPQGQVSANPRGEATSRVSSSSPVAAPTARPVRKGRSAPTCEGRQTEQTPTCMRAETCKSFLCLGKESDLYCGDLDGCCGQCLLFCFYIQCSCTWLS